MLDGNRTGIAGSAGDATGTEGARANPRFALVIGLLLGGVLVAVVQAAFPVLVTPASKTEDRLAASATSAAGNAACIALVQDRVTGATVAVDCGQAIPLPATRRSREIES